jgi:hypothetical protein
MIIGPPPKFHGTRDILHSAIGRNVPISRLINVPGQYT